MAARGEVGLMMGAEPGYRRLQMWRSLYIQENYFVVSDDLLDKRRREIEERIERINAELDDWPLRLKDEKLHVSMFNVRPPHMALSYSCRNNKELFRSLSSLKRRLFPELTTSVAENWGVSADPATRKANPVKRGRIRVAFIAERLNRFSSVLRDRMGVICNLPKSHFHVTAMTFAAPKDDPASQMLLKNVEQHVVLPTDPRTHIPYIAAQGFDVIVFPEISLVGFTNFIPYNRLAPLQINTWGHSDTSGIDTVDMYVSSRWFEKEGAQEHYTEELALTEGLSTHYFHATDDNATAKLEGRASFGLPEGPNLYLMMQTLGKLHKSVINMFRAVLVHDPTGILVITGSNSIKEQESFYRALEVELGTLDEEWWDEVDEFDSTGDKTAAAGPLIDRVRFLPFQEYKRGAALIRCCSVMLDGYAFGGCNTTLEALDLGTPVVTCPTDFLHGRFTQGYLRRLGMPELIADTPYDCGRIAAQVALDPLATRRYEVLLAERKHVLFNEDDAILEWNRLLLDRSAPYVTHLGHNEMMAKVVEDATRAFNECKFNAWLDRGTLRGLVADKMFPKAPRAQNRITVASVDFGSDSGRAEARAAAARAWDHVDLTVQYAGPAVSADKLKAALASVGDNIVSERGSPNNGWRLTLLVHGVPVRVAVAQSAPSSSKRPGIWTATYDGTTQRQVRNYFPPTTMTKQEMKAGDTTFTAWAPKDPGAHLSLIYGPTWTVKNDDWKQTQANNRVYPAAFTVGRFDLDARGHLTQASKSLLQEMVSSADYVGVGVFGDLACRIGGRKCSHDCEKRKAAVENYVNGLPPGVEGSVFEVSSRAAIGDLMDRADFTEFAGVDQIRGYPPEIGLFLSKTDAKAVENGDISVAFSLRASAFCTEEPWLSAKEARALLAAEQKGLQTASIPPAGAASPQKDGEIGKKAPLRPGKPTMPSKTPAKVRTAPVRTPVRAGTAPAKTPGRTAPAKTPVRTAPAKTPVRTAPATRREELQSTDGSVMVAPIVERLPGSKVPASVASVKSVARPSPDMSGDDNVSQEERPTSSTRITDFSTVD
jgi:hypothetical protein